MKLPCFCPTLLRGLVAILCLGATAKRVWAGPGHSAETGAHVVLIISDDQAYGDHGFMGNNRVRTPNLDRLAARSARYVNGYVPSSVCRPSLATILTGLYPHQHAVHFNHPPPGFRRLGQMPSAETYDAARGRAVQLFQESPNLPTLLAKAGYASFQAGKHWEGTYRDAGFTEGMTVARPCFDQPWNRQLPGGQWVAHGNGDAGLVIGRRAMQPVFDFIDRHSERPFFLCYAPVLPHEPHDAPARYRELYRGAPGLPPHLLAYYANIAWFDDTVGQLLDYIERKGLTKNTLFVYLCDNGATPQVKSPYKVDPKSKRSPFENGLRTPILLRWDGHIQPATHEGLVSSVDLLPTILSALRRAADSNLPSPPPAKRHGGGEGRVRGNKCSSVARLSGDAGRPALSGIDLMPSATGQQPLAPDRPVFGEIYPGDATTLGQPQRHVAYRWVRQGPLKLIVPHAHDGRQPWGNFLDRPALFHVVDDPGETKDLSGNPAYAEDMARLTALLDDWWNPRDADRRG